jgi:hypothetical protein
MGCRCFLCTACNGGIRHGLANLGGQDSRHRHADTKICDYESGACGDSVCSRQDWVEAANTQSGDTGGDSGQRDPLSYFANRRAEANRARHLYCECSLRALFNLGDVWRMARWCTQAVYRSRTNIGCLNDVDGRLACQIAIRVTKGLLRSIANLRRPTNRCTRAAGACFSRCFISSTWPVPRRRVNSAVKRRAARRRPKGSRRASRSALKIWKWLRAD